MKVANRSSRIVRMAMALMLGSAAIAPMTPLMAEAPQAAAQQAEQTRELLFVQSTLSRDIQVVDANTFEVIDNIYVGDDTDDVIGSPDGRVLYANAQISDGNPLSRQANHMGKVNAYDAATRKLLWSVGVDGSPHHLAVTPDGKRLIVPLFDRNHYVEIDTETGTVVAQHHSYMGNHTSKVSKDGKRIIFGNMIADALMIHDAATGDIVKVINVTDAVRPFVLSPDEKLVYYQLSRLHGFEVRDMASGKMVKKVDLPPLDKSIALPEFYPHTYDHGLEMTHDGKVLLANGSIAGYVALYSLPDLKLLGTIPVGEDPNWIIVRGDNKIAFISNRGSDDLSVIDIASMKEIKRVKLGDMPQRMNMIHVPVSGS